MKSRIFILIICFFLFSSVFIFSQSSFLEEGVSGTGFYVSGIIEDSNLSTIGFSTAYSIGGIMDFGVRVSTEQGSIDNNESTDLDFSLLYNLIVIKQNTIQPINVQLEGSYGYINTTSDYLDYYSRRRNGQGFNLGVFIFHNFFTDSILSLNLGGRMNYRNYFTTIYDYSNPNVPELVSDVRSETITYGGSAALIFHPELWPMFNLDLVVMYNSSEEVFEYTPSISIINPQF